MWLGFRARRGGTTSSTSAGSDNPVSSQNVGAGKHVEPRCIAPLPRRWPTNALRPLRFAVCVRGAFGVMQTLSWALKTQLPPRLRHGPGGKKQSCSPRRFLLGHSLGTPPDCVCAGVGETPHALGHSTSHSKLPRMLNSLSCTVRWHQRSSKPRWLPALGWRTFAEDPVDLGPAMEWEEACRRRGNPIQNVSLSGDKVCFFVRSLAESVFGRNSYTV